MTTGRRVERLRDLVEEIERLPVSPVRDRLLNEVRSRAVDVDTGVTPRAMLPMREPAPPPEPARPEKRDGAKFLRRVMPRTPALAVGSAHARSACGRPEHAETFLLDGLLSLDDTLPLPPLPHVRARSDRAVPPWGFGLRG
jgi:hypothetical protein